MVELHLNALRGWRITHHAYRDNVRRLALAVIIDDHAVIAFLQLTNDPSLNRIGSLFRAL